MASKDSKNRAKSMLKGTKSFEEWRQGMSEAELERVRQVHGDPKEFYDRFVASLRDVARNGSPREASAKKPGRKGTK